MFILAWQYNLHSQPSMTFVTFQLLTEYKQTLPQIMFSDLISSMMICMVFSSGEDKEKLNMASHLFLTQWLLFSTQHFLQFLL